MANFFKDLFDMSFERFITPKIASAVYGVVIFVAALQAIASIASWGLWGLIAGVGVFFAMVFAARVFIEASLSTFQIAKYAREIAHQGRAHTAPQIRPSSSASPSAPPPNSPPPPVL